MLAIIPARAGSKGLPRKNILDFCGKPLLAWSIEAALSCNYVDSVLVSTDSEEIATIARNYGADVPFLRPKYLSTDEAGSIEVLMHCIEFMAKKEFFYEYIVLLEPTSPIRYKGDIDRALEMLRLEEGATSIVSVTRVESQHPSFLMKKDSKNFLISYENPGIKRRQEISELYHLDGTVYISEVESLCTNKTFYHDKTIGVSFKKWQSFEIDDEIDFYAVECLMKKYGGA